MEYTAQLETNNRIKLLEPFTGAKIHHRMQCMVCQHMWSATPLSKSQAFKKTGSSGCPACARAAKDATHTQSRQQNLQSLADRNIEVLTPGYDGRREVDGSGKIEVRNSNCGHIFTSTPANLLNTNIRCSVCGAQSRVDAFTKQSKETSPRSAWRQYAETVRVLSTKTYEQHTSTINPTNKPRGRADYPGSYKLEHIAPVRFCFSRNVPPHVCADVTNLRLVKWTDKVGSRSEACSIPHAISVYLSKDDKLNAAADILQSIIPDSERFAVVSGVTTTVYVKSTNRAVVVLPIDETQANQKTGLAIRKALVASGVGFTILFEDELRDRRLLAAKLQHYNHTSRVQRIHARSCTIRQVSVADKRQLLVANHVQGNDIAQVCYGAYYGDALVAVMTFAIPRVALGQKDRTNLDGVWELSRFCTDVNYRIPGIASKLLTHFKRNHVWREIYSYADKRWSVGNMYHQLGFVLVADNPPDYFYVVGGVRKHRWSYRKDALRTMLPNYNPTLTEYQNMEAHGYWRVWGCGTLKFSMVNSENVE